MPRANWIRRLSLHTALCSALVAFAFHFLAGGVAQAQPTVQFEGVGQYVAYRTDGTFKINITLSEASSDVVTVQWTTFDGTATSPADYIAAADTAIFPAGSTQQQIQVTLVNNGQTAETYFAIGLSNPQGATTGSPSGAQIYLAVRPPPPTVQFAAATYTVNENGGSVSIEVTLSAVPATTATVNFATADGPSPNGAVDGTNYTAISGTLTFDPNDPVIANRTSQTFTVAIIDDGLPGPNRTVTLTLSAPNSGATMGSQSTAVLTIIDNDPPPPVLVLTVTPATNPICAGALPTAVHQTAINVSLTDGTGGVYNVPLTISTTAGTLAGTSGATDVNGSFTTTLTSSHRASGVSTPFTATVTVVAGALTQTAQVTFNPPTVALSSDVATIPPGGVAKLTAALTFNGQPVAGHNLEWSIAGVWDASGKPVFGPARAEYGHIELGASATSDSFGNGTAVWKAGHENGKVEIQVMDKSVHLAPGAKTLSASISFQEKEEKPSVEITAVFGEGERKWVVAGFPPPRDMVVNWSAKLVGAKESAAAMKYQRGTGGLTEVPWKKSTVTRKIKFANSILDCQIQAVDGASKHPEMELNKDGVLIISGVQQGDKIFVEATAFKKMDRVAIVKNFTWNDLERLGGKISMHPDFDGLPAALKDDILDTIKFVLDPKKDSSQEKQRKKLAADLLKPYEDGTLTIKKPDPAPASQDIPSALGVGQFPQDFDHGHFAIERKTIPAEYYKLEAELVGQRKSKYANIEDQRRYHWLQKQRRSREIQEIIRSNKWQIYQIARPRCSERKKP
jgi:hypothetical protein